MEQFLANLRSLDRRIIYLAIGAVLIVSLLLGKPETGIIMPQAAQFFQAVDGLPQDRLVLVDATFSASTLPENGNQLRALLRHLVLTHHPFALMALDPNGATLGQQIAADVTGQYHAVYGRDWINFGYLYVGSAGFFKGFPKDIPGWVKVDATLNKPLTGANFPIMQGVTGFNHSVSMLVEITASASVYDWMFIVQPATQPRLKIGYACTNVMTTDAFQYLSSGQLSGLMAGLKGAADYEQLDDELEASLVKGGQGLWWWWFALLCGLLFFTVYIPKLSWINRFALGVIMGWSAGIAFQQFVGQMAPQMVDAFNAPVTTYNPSPMLSATAAPLDRMNNLHAGLWWHPFLLLGLIVLLCTMAYFFFSVEHKRSWIRVPATAGRYFVMITLGAIFGTTVMSRLTLLIGRLEFLHQAVAGWWHMLR